VNKPSHPTRERLIETMATLLDGDDTEHITADQVLSISGISKGSLYHHFEDFDELLEASLIRRFSQNVDVSIEALLNIMATAKSRDELMTMVQALNAHEQDAARAPFRLERARAAGLTHSSPRFTLALGVEQERLTDAFTDLIAEGQNKGWFTTEIDARAGAVFIQAYTLGRVVDDIASDKVDPAAWTALTLRAVERIFSV
jgi:AcrR family transcriptional regulator